MRLVLFGVSIVLGAALLSGCKIKKHLTIADANEADATLVLQYEHGFEHYVVEWGEAEDKALERCEVWGYSGVDFSEAGTIECIEKHEKKVVGARPPGESEESGMGTQAAERERMRRGVGTVGEGVGHSPPAGAERGCVYWRVTYIGRCFNEEE